MRASRPKLNALTGLRFIAAALIVVEHSVVFHIPVPSFRWGHGVSFFFILSGFVIAYAYPRFDSGRAVWAFLIARVARIWPAHIVAIVLTIVLLSVPFDPLKLAANVLLIQGWVPSFPWYFSYNAVSWSISTELFFYLAFPTLIFHWRKTWWWKWLLSALLIFTLARLCDALNLPKLAPDGGVSAHGLLYINPLSRLFEFVTGMATCSAYRALKPAADKMSMLALSLLEILAVAVVSYSLATGFFGRLLVPFFTGAADQWRGQSSDVLTFPFLILVFAFGRGWLSGLLGSWPMILLGDMSYSIYLVHQPMFGHYITQWETDHDAPDYVGLVACLVATLIISFLILKLVEGPCRAAVKRWLRGLSLQPLLPLEINQR